MSLQRIWFREFDKYARWSRTDHKKKLSSKSFTRWLGCEDASRCQWIWTDVSVPTASERIFPVSCCDRSLEKDRPRRVDIQELLTRPLVLIYYKEESYRGTAMEVIKDIWSNRDNAET